MGNRITRAARHLSADEIQKRIQGEQRLWRRQRWEILDQALRAPRQAEDIAKTVGVSLWTVRRVIALYKHGGVAAMETPGKGGRRHQHLTLAQERAFLQPFWARAARGELVTAVEIKRAFEAQIGHEINKSTSYRLLDRQGWQQLSVQAGPAQANGDKLTRSDTVPARERREPSPMANRELSAQRYPSDLRDQDWARLSPLIPRAKPGGRPRTVNMREVINAILYVDRTGCQWRAFPRDFPRLYHGLDLLPRLAPGGYLAAHPHSTARAGTREAGA